MIRANSEIVGQYGSNSHGQYIKFPNGIMICTSIHNATESIDNASSSIYYKEVTYDSILPANFIEEPFYDNVQVYNTDRRIVWAVPTQTVSKTNWYNSVFLCSQSIRTNYTYKLKFVAIGRWK